MDIKYRANAFPIPFMLAMDNTRKASVSVCGRQVLFPRCYDYGLGVQVINFNLLDLKIK